MRRKKHFAKTASSQPKKQQQQQSTTQQVPPNQSIQRPEQLKSLDEKQQLLKNFDSACQTRTNLYRRPSGLNASRLALIMIGERNNVSNSYIQTFLKVVASLPEIVQEDKMQAQSSAILQGSSHFHRIMEATKSRSNCIAQLRQMLKQAQSRNYMSLRELCLRIQHLRVITLILIERVGEWQKYLNALTSYDRPCFKQTLAALPLQIQNADFLQHLGYDCLFLSFSQLNRFIKFSKSPDPLFLVPLYYHNNPIGTPKQEDCVVKLFTLSESDLQRLQQAAGLLRIYKQMSIDELGEDINRGNRLRSVLFGNPLKRNRNPFNKHKRHFTQTTESSVDVDEQRSQKMQATRPRLTLLPKIKDRESVATQPSVWLSTTLKDAQKQHLDLNKVKQKSQPITTSNSNAKEDPPKDEDPSLKKYENIEYSEASFAPAETLRKTSPVRLAKRQSSLLSYSELETQTKQSKLRQATPIQAFQGIRSAVVDSSARKIGVKGRRPAISLIQDYDQWLAKTTQSKCTINNALLSMKSIPKFFYETIRPCLNEVQFSSLQQAVLKPHNNFRNYYTNLLKQNGEQVAIAICQPVKNTQSRTLLVTHFVFLLQKNNYVIVDPRKVLLSYVRYLFLSDPCEFVAFGFPKTMQDNKQKILAILLQSGFKESRLDVGAGSMEQSIYVLPRKNEQKKEQTENTCLFLQMSTLVSDFFPDPKNMFKVQQVDVPNRKNFADRLLFKDCVSAFAYIKKIRTGYDLKKIRGIAEPKSKPQCNVKALKSLEAVNEALEDFQAQKFESSINLADGFVLGKLSIYDELEFDYLCNSNYMYARSDKSNILCGVTAKLQYALLKVKDSNCQLYLAVWKELVEPDPKVETDIGTSFYELLSHLNQPEERNFKEDVVIKIRLFKKKLSGWSRNIDQSMSAFNKVNISFNYAHYLNTYKIYDIEGEETLEFSSKMNVGVVIVGEQVYSGGLCVRIQDADFL